MRVLDAQGVRYTHFSYDANKYRTGTEIASALNENPAQVFKTLVTVAGARRFYVFMLPVCAELDLKRAALSVNEKSVNMLPQRELLPLTGYVHGGCSPIGMKKQFHTVIDTSAQNFAEIIFSAGRVGHQVRLSPTDLAKIVPINYADICME